MDATVGVALWLSLKVAGLATLLNIVLGTAAGFALARWRFAGRDVLDTVLTLPMVMPPTVLAIICWCCSGATARLAAGCKTRSASI